MSSNIIFTILGMGCLMPIVHTFEYYKQFLQYFNIDMKPFNCVMCSTFWFTFGVSVIPFGINAIFMASIAAVLAELIDIQLHKL